MNPRSRPVLQTLAFFQTTRNSPPSVQSVGVLPYLQDHASSLLLSPSGSNSSSSGSSSSRSGGSSSSCSSSSSSSGVVAAEVVVVVVCGSQSYTNPTEPRTLPR